jgi:hypothetical protein
MTAAKKKLHIVVTAKHAIIHVMIRAMIHAMTHVMIHAMTHVMIHVMTHVLVEMKALAVKHGIVGADGQITRHVQQAVQTAVRHNVKQFTIKTMKKFIVFLIFCK